MRWLAPVLALLWLSLPGALGAQAVRGHLLDAESGRAIEGGRVVLLTQDSLLVQSVITDPSGAFQFAAARPGAYRLQGEQSGYLSAVTPSIDLRARDTLDVELRLSMRVVVLQPLTVVGDARRTRGGYGGFYERMKRNAFGTFISREKIDQLHPVLASDLLRSVPGVQVVPTWWGRGVVVIRGTCIPAIYLDGLRIRTSSIDDLVSPQELEGIEVYRNAADAPVELMGGTPSCGAVALWTRVG